MAIKYTWDEIADNGCKIDEEGVAITLKGEKKPPTAEPPTPTTLKAYPKPLPKPISTDSIDAVLDEKTFVFTDDDGTKRLVIPDVVCMKEIVQDYEGEGKIYKPSAEVEATLQFFENLPITDGHPESGLISTPAEIMGTCTNPRFVDGGIFCDLEVINAGLIERIESGDLRQVSPGFQSDVLMDGGTFGETPYDGIQKGILPDHLAIVKEGRCSLDDGCGISDDVIKQAKTVVDQEKEKIINEITSRTSHISKDELEKKPLERLSKDLALIKKIQADAAEAKRIRAPDKNKDGEQDTRKRINEAYDKINR